MSASPLAKPEIERAIVGALILDPGRITETKETLFEDDFESPVLKHLFRGLTGLSNGGAAVDLPTILTWLGSDGESSSIQPRGGWHAYLAEIMSAVSVANLVMIDLLSESVLCFRSACSQLSRRRADRPVRTSTLYRWSSEGLRGVKLETIQIGGTRCTSVEALQRFFDLLGQQKMETGKRSPKR